VSSALTPIARQTHDAAAARKLQQQKNVHQAEDIEELDDSGVDGVGEERREKDKRDQQEEGKRKLEEKVEIASLKEARGGTGAEKAPPAEGAGRLDISA
jgi:hypothetical protein